MSSEAATWAMKLDRLFRLLPYGLLAVSATAGLARPGEPVAARLTTLALTVAAVVWVRAMYPRSAHLPDTPVWRRVVYVAGVHVLSGLAMAHDPVFLVFGITGLAHPPMLLPTPLAFLFTGVGSVLINTVPFGLPDDTIEAVAIWGAIIVIQTGLVGASGLFGAKQEELSEQRRRTVAELESALEENKGLHAQLVVQAREAGVVDERRRMAREIHDTLAQGLAGIVTQLQAADRARDQRGDWQRHVDAAAGLARESLAEARRSVDALRPQALESAELGEALTQVAARWSRVSGVPAEFRVTGTVRGLDPEVEVALLRTAQEALANVARHAAASKVVVTLSYMGDAVTLDVRDDGVGFTPAAPAGGFGLESMRQRLDRLAGHLAVESEPGGGTAVCAAVPASPSP